MVDRVEIKNTSFFLKVKTFKPPKPVWRGCAGFLKSIAVSVNKKFFGEKKISYVEMVMIIRESNLKAEGSNKRFFWILFPN